MKKSRHVSDLTGKDIDNDEDVIHVSIKREGHGVKLKNGTYFGDTVLDITEDELPDLLKEVKFVKSISSDVQQSIVAEMKASFSSPVGVN